MDVAYWQPAAEEAARNSQSLQSSSSKTGLARSLYRNRDKKMAFRFYDLAAIFFLRAVGYTSAAVEKRSAASSAASVICVRQFSRAAVHMRAG